MGPKIVPERAADSCSLWHHFFLLNKFSGYLEYSHGTKNKCQREKLIAALSGNIFFVKPIFRLSQI